MPLGKLEKVELRSVWKNESAHFTPWLAKEENILELSETLDIDLEVQAQEQKVGPFRADILCKDASSDRFVLIENQFEYTDHKHLGQLMTYAAGLNAVTIIWVAEKFTEEHRAALDWLNRITDESVDFFGVEIELYRIGISSPAPKFNIVSKPNNWSKTIKRNAESAELTATKILQQEYWQALKTYMEKEKSFIRTQKPLYQHWYNIAIGKSDVRLSVFVNSVHETIGVNLNLLGSKAKENFKKLYESCYDESLRQFENKIEWMELPDGKESKVRVVINADYENKNDWFNQHKQLKELIEKMYQFFSNRVKEI